MAGATNWTWRQILFYGGIALWFVATLVQARTGTLLSLWTALLFAALLLVVTIPTRTLTLAELIQPFCLGGAMIGIAVIAGWGFDLALGKGDSATRALGMPVVEELLKIAPALWVLYRLRERRWTLGATDVLLLAAASGLGFYFTEEAFVFRNLGTSFLGSFPTTDVVSDRHGTRMIAGHAIWTSIAGLTIGLALVLRGSKAQMMMIGAAGLLWSSLDHGANNYIVTFGNVLSKAFEVITGKGYLSLYIFVLGTALAVIVDLYFAYVRLPKLNESRFPAMPTSWAGFGNAWKYLLLRRRFAFAVARYQREDGMDRARAAVVAAGLDAKLHNWHLQAEALRAR
jgi:RsiW-degrading membrane proteinase PrsW (M82 family)